MSISTPDNTTCPLCGSAVEPNHRFCPTCAHPLSATTSEPLNRVTGSATNLSDQAPAKPQQNSLTTQINKFLGEGQDPAAVRQAYQAVLKILSDQEEVSYIAVQKMPGLPDWSATIVLTNNRLIVYHNNNKGQGELKDYHWADIRSFSKQETPTAITISFVTSASLDRAIRIDHLSDVQGWKLYQYAIKKVKGRALSNTVHPDSEISVTANPSILMRKFSAQFGGSESNILSNRADRVIAHRRNPAVVIALGGGLALIIVVCIGLLLFNNTTVDQRKVQVIATTQAMAVIAHATETARVPAGASATIGAVARQVAATEIPPSPLPSPSPTPIPIMAIQDTAMFPGWLLSIGKVEARTKLRTSEGDVYTPNGRFWMVWVDAKNTGDTASSLDAQFVFDLQDATGKAFIRGGGLGWEQTDAVMKTENRDGLSANVPPGYVTHALLIFDMVGDSLPQQLRITRSENDNKQSLFDLTTAAPAQATAVTLAASTETAVAVAQSTAEAAASETAVAQRLASTYATSTAVAKAANATATTEAKAANATATAVRKTYESYRTTAPKGNFTESGRRVAIDASFRYENCVASWCADKNSKFIVVWVTVSSGNKTISVNPLYFTLINTDGYVVDVDTATYGMSNYLDAVNLQPNTYTSGYIAFLTNKSFIPSRLIWEDFDETVTVKIVDPAP